MFWITVKDLLNSAWADAFYSRLWSSRVGQISRIISAAAAAAAADDDHDMINRLALSCRPLVR